MLPILILDAYLDQLGGARSFQRLLGGRPAQVLRTTRDPLPRDASAFSAILMSGSAASLLAPPTWVAPTLALLRNSLEHGIPVLGVCFGHQMLAEAAFGAGTVRRASRGELGWIEIVREAPDPLLDVLPPRFSCFASHLDEVAATPPGMRVLARSEACAVQAFRVEDRPAWGVQFHPEMELEEASALVRSGLREHPHLGGDPEAALTGARDTSSLGHALVERFMGLAPLAPQRIDRSAAGC